MADWRKVSWKSTWGNQIYRRAILFGILSCAAGGITMVLSLTDNAVYMWGVIALHSLYAHITCYEMAHPEVEEDERDEN